MRAGIEYGQWLPDQADYLNPGLVDCVNVLPSSDGYSPFLQGVETGQSIPGDVIGAKRFDTSDGVRVIVAGTATDLYVQVGGAVTASGLSLSADANNPWSFEQFGSAIYATSKAGGTYYLPNVDSDTQFIAALGGPPSGAALARIDDFLFYGNLTDIDASNAPFRIRWSSFNNPENTWGTNVATQSGALDLPDRFGVVTGISGGDLGIVMQRRAVHSIDYVGGANAFNRAVIEEERGCASPKSVVSIGDVVYFVADDGFCRCDGVSVEVISSQRVWDWFQANSNPGLLTRIHGTADWLNRCVIWAFCGVSETSFTGLIVYNWEQERWSRVELPVGWLVETTLDGVTLDQLDALYGSIDDIPVSLDSPEFDARARALSSFVASGGNSNLLNMQGAALEAVFETGDMQVEAGRRTRVTEITPIVENTSENSQVSVGTREKSGSDVSFLDYQAEGPHGYCPVVADGRYIRFRHRIPAGSQWDKATGLLHDAKASGWG